MRTSTPPVATWLLGVVIVALAAGGVAQIIADRTDPIVETTVTERVALPEDQAEVVGTIDGFVAEDAVGSGGLATPRDSVTFTAGEETTITTSGRAVAGRPLPVRLEGPGTFAADGTFRITTRDGTTTATRLEFGPGPFVVDVADDGTFAAVFNGPLTST